MNANSNDSSALKLINYSEFLHPASIKAYFTTRYGGVSQAEYSSLNLGRYTDNDVDYVNQNHQILRANLPPKARVIYGKQVHGNSIYIDDGSVNGLVGEYDGLISCYSDVMLLTYHADCLPVYATVVGTEWFGVAHSGWKGTYAKIANQLVEALCEQSGGSVENVKIVIGPGIAKQSYQVDQTLYDQFLTAFGSRAVDYTDGIYALDLGESIAIGLEQIHLKRSQIWIDSRDTFRDESLFSYRRQGAQSGRMAAIIMKC